MNFRIASFDLGIHHLPVVVEEISFSDFVKLRETMPASKWFDDNNLPLPEATKWLDRLTDCGQLVYVDQQDFAKDQAFPGQILPQAVLVAMRQWIRGLTPILSTCQCILIEQQVNKNPLAQRIEQHIHTLLLEYLELPLSEDRCRIYIYSSRYKTHLLGAPKKIKKGTAKLVKLGTAKKQWAEQCAQRILVRRREITWLDRMRWMAGESRASSHRKPKLDDQADCLLMIQSCKILLLRPKQYKKLTLDVDVTWLEAAITQPNRRAEEYLTWSCQELDTVSVMDWMAEHLPGWKLVTTHWWSRQQPLHLECSAGHQIWLSYPCLKYNGWRCATCQPTFIADQHLPILCNHLDIPLESSAKPSAPTPSDKFFAGVPLSQFETRYTPVYCPTHNKVRSLTQTKLTALRLVSTKGRRTKCWCE